MGVAQSLPASTYDLPLVLDEIESIVAPLRRQLDDASAAVYRSAGFLHFAAAILLTTVNLLELPRTSLTFEAIGSDALTFSVPLVLVGLGIAFVWRPRGLRRFQNSNRSWLRRAFTRQRIVDSRLAEVMDELSWMQREISRAVDSTAVLSILQVVLLAGLALLSWVAATSLGIFPHAVTPLIPGAVTATLAGATAVGTLAIVWRGRRELRRSRAMLAELSRSQYRIGSIQQAFWGRY